MLYNVDLLAQYGSATYQSAVWDSATYGSSNPVSPTSLVMQQVRTCSASFAPALCLAPWILPPILSPAAQDCNLVLLSGANALIYSSSTGGEGTACALTVSGLGGGLIRVSSSNSTVLYVQPSAFQILLEGQSPTFSGSENQERRLPGGQPAAGRAGLHRRAHTAAHHQLRPRLRLPGRHLPVRDTTHEGVCAKLNAVECSLLGGARFARQPLLLTLCRRKTQDACA